MQAGFHVSQSIEENPLGLDGDVEAGHNHLSSFEFEWASIIDFNGNLVIRIVRSLATRNHKV